MRGLAEAMLLAACAGCQTSTPGAVGGYGQPVAAAPDVGGERVSVGPPAPDPSTAAGDSTPNGICPPAGGNELGVGTRCTPGGGQCDALTAQFCSADYTSLPLWFCTTLCDGSTHCGSNALCGPDPANQGVFVCLPQSCSILPVPATIPPISACLPANPGPQGLGTPCTAGGGECRNLTAGICTVDALPKAPFALCTFACNDDQDCDTNSRCILAPGGLRLKVCLPRACLP